MMTMKAAMNGQRRGDAEVFIGRFFAFRLADLRGKQSIPLGVKMLD
jgi:hypothetical protein